MRCSGVLVWVQPSIGGKGPVRGFDPANLFFWLGFPVMINRCNQHEDSQLIWMCLVIIRIPYWINIFLLLSWWAEFFRRAGVLRCSYRCGGTVRSDLWSGVECLPRNWNCFHHGQWLFVKSFVNSSKHFNPIWTTLWISINHDRNNIGEYCEVRTFTQAFEEGLVLLKS